MPALVPPRLDDRTWQELRDELIARIPVHDPAWAWTDHNPSDPGVALLEVFAWLAENLLRRMDRVPDKALVQFLNLLGVQPRPAAVARARVRLDLPKGALDPMDAPWSPASPRLQVAAGKLRFSALGEIRVLPLEGLAAIKVDVGTADLDPDDLERARQTLMAHLGDDPATDPEPTLRPYETRRIEAPVAGRLGDPVELADTVDRSLWIALLAPADVLKVHLLEDVRRAVAGSVLSVGFWADETLEPGDVVPCDGDEAETDVRWEVSTGGFLDGGTTVRELRYARLAVVEDDTGGAARTGVVRLLLPDEDQLGTWALEDPEGRPVDGVGDLPPALDDAALEARVVAWVRLRWIEGPSRRVRFADLNVVEVEHAVLAGRELLGTGSARAGAVVKLSQTPVLPDSVRIEVREPTAGWVPWTRVDDLAGSRGDDPHYVLEPATGEVRFGDAIHGRMPGQGAPIRASAYRWGGGAAGNVPPGSIAKVLEPASLGTLRVTQLLPASGGQDSESPEEAKVNLPKTLRHNDRAVARQDFADLTLLTPGGGLGRCEVLARHLPEGHVDEVPGVVSLVLVPAWDPEHPDEPVPDREVIRRVCAWLEPRRLCTTELFLLAPEYVEVWVAVAVEIKPGYGLQTVKRWVELAIRQHLAPLPPYGPAGAGWPFGRNVRVADIEAAAVAVDGVEVVTDVVLRGIAIDRYGVRTAVASPDPCDPQPVPIHSWQLPVVRDVRVAVGETAPELDDTPPPEEPQGWPVPAARETC
jgi:hypothetical protein